MTQLDTGTMQNRFDLEQPEPRQQEQPKNLSETERIVSMASGGMLALFGLSRRSIPGLAIAAVGGALIQRGATGYCALYNKLGIDTKHTGAEPQDYFERGIHVEAAYTINKLPWELYDFWRNFENLPKFMEHLESVTVKDQTHSHWIAKAPAGRTVEWDAEIINDEPNALISWRSMPGADVDNAGSIRFVPAAQDRGTEVRVVLDYIPPAGQIGRWVAKLFGEEPQQQIQEDLRRFKRLMETGEIPTTDGQPRGTCGR